MDLAEEFYAFLFFCVNVLKSSVFENGSVGCETIQSHFEVCGYFVRLYCIVTEVPCSINSRLQRVHERLRFFMVSSWCQATPSYRKAYKTHYARVNRGQMSNDEFEAWKVRAQEKRDQAQAGELDMYDYEEWMKQ